MVWSVRHCKVIWGWSCKSNVKCGLHGPTACDPHGTALPGPLARGGAWQRHSQTLRDMGPMGMCDSAEQYPRVASAVADSGCDTSNLNCFFRRGKSRGHISVSCCQHWLWQQSFCVGFVASWFNIWARSLQGSDCLLPSFLSFLL